MGAWWGRGLVGIGAGGNGGVVKQEWEKEGRGVFSEDRGREGEVWRYTGGGVSVGEAGGAYAQLQPSVSPRPSRLSPERPLPAGLGLRDSLQRLLLPSHRMPGTTGAWRGAEWWEHDQPFFTIS